MSNIIPPLVSDSPPPPPSEEDEDDEFDDFRGSNDISYGCDSFSLSPSPEQSPKKVLKESHLIQQEPVFQFTPVTLDSVQSAEEKSQMNCLNTNGSLEKDILKSIPSSLNHENIEDNIPCQLITKNGNAKHENDERNCDNSDNIDESLKEFHIHARNSIVSKSCLSNGFPISENHDNISKIYNLSSDVELSPTDKNDEKIVNIADFSSLNAEEKNNQINDDKIHSKQNSSDIDLVKETEDIQENEIIDGKDRNDDSVSDILTIQDATEETGDNFGTFVSSSVEIQNVISESDQNVESCTKKIEKLSLFEKEKDDPGILNDSSEEVCFDTEDDFGNFSSFSTFNQDPKQTNHETSHTFSEQNDNNKVEDDFANFASFSPVEHSHSLLRNDSDTLFNTFTSFPIDTIQKPPDAQMVDDDFGEFTSIPIEQSSQQSEFAKTELFKPLLLLGEEEAFEKTKEIVKDMFAPSEEVFDDFQYFELGKGDFIFTQLQDVTETPALGYNWSKSSSQKLLLRALNIDSRNILYGHSWNSSVPRFAANLGVQPLEPIKMEPLTPTPSELIAPAPQTSQSESAEVPSAQFDWTGSGLVNPLDCSPRDSAAQVSKSTPTLNPQKNIDDLEEFTSFQTSEAPQVSIGWPSIPLRETHISDVPQAHIDVDVFLQPTIVTPEMPRKEISTEDDLVFSQDKGGNIKHEENVEFDEFQMVLPVDNTMKTQNDENVINDNVGLEERGLQSASTDPPDDDFSEFHSTIPITKPHQEEDDDFTEFHSSIPLSQTQVVPQAQTAPVLAPILEPLQPTPVYTTPSSTQINWPDPGITLDELQRFEEAFSAPLSQKKDEKAEEQSAVLEKVVQVKREVKQRSDIPVAEISQKFTTTKQEPKKVIPKQNSLEEDEWSDFVSVQKPSPVHKTKLTDRTQTSSPDLPLSVLNLGNIQPTKQPIPVITPQGLVQTKLSTNMSPVVQQKIVNRPPYDLPPLQPSIISNQYANQAYSFGTTRAAGQIVQNGQDDDEWGEFVSSPLPPQYQNSSTTVGNHGWNNFVPNVRMNSVQGTYNQPSSSARTVSGNAQRKNIVSGLVLPDLDFLALKERSGVPRKK